MKHNAFDWTDLQFLFAVARTGSLLAAARVLGVHHSTVQRRVTAFERIHGIRLFDRSQTGYALTPSGEEMLAAAQGMADIAGDLERRLAGRDLRLEGSLRVTTTDTLMASLLPPILHGFNREHPAVKLEISVASAPANLDRRDADVAIRATSAPPDTLVGRRIASVGYALYSSANAAGSPIGSPLAMPYLAPSETLAETVVARWMRSKGLMPAAALRCDSLTAMASAAAAGMGVAPLPCYYGDGHPGLARPMPDTIADMPVSDIWVLTHADLRRSARVRVFSEYVGQALTAKRSHIEGIVDAPLIWGTVRGGSFSSRQVFTADVIG